MSAISAAAMAMVSQEPVKSDSLTRLLTEVVVAAKQPATRLEGSTLVTSVPGSNLQTLGTAVAVLPQLPMITINDDEVSVAGKGSPQVYIDGRPMNDYDELRQLRSDNIKRVEVEMAPGAMYGSDVKAVLKITTRRNFLQGLSLTERVETERRRRWSANNLLDMNYRRGEWDFFATGTVAHNNSLVKGRTTNTLDYKGQKTIVGGSQHNEYPADNATVKAGFNYASEKGMSAGAYYRYNPEKADLLNTGAEWLNEMPHIDREISRKTCGRNHLGAVYYDNTFAGKYQLHFDGNYRWSTWDSNVLTHYKNDMYGDVSSSDHRSSTLWAGKLYLKFPIWGGLATIGTQESYTCTSLDYKMNNAEIGEYIPSSLTDGRQISAAAFLTWKKAIGRFSLSGGLRYEHVDYLFKVDGKRDCDVSRRDNLLTPDISLGYSPDDQSQIGLSYKMSMIRPPYSQLTGSLAYVGRHEIEGGNPSLRDERMHDLQFFGMWNGFMLQADVTRSIDTYGFVKRVYPADNLQLLMRPVNIDVSAIDVYFVWSKNIGAWSPNYSLGMRRQWLEIEGTKYNKPICSYSLENMIALPCGFLITINARGQSSGDMHTNRFGTTWLTMDASIGKTFLNKALQIKLSAKDVLNTANNDWTMNTYGVFVDKQQSYDRRGVSLSVSYRFQPRQSKYKGGTASESEMNRL